MRFESAPDYNHLTHRMVSGRIEIGVYRVLFGYRVRAGYIDNGYYHLDYCCGAGPEWINRVYGIILTVMDERDESNAFDGFPQQQVKPIENDHECFVNLAKMMKGRSPIKVNLPVQEVDPDDVWRNLFTV